MKQQTTQTKRLSFKEGYSKTCLMALIIFCNYHVFSQNMTYTINDPEDLRNVIYQPGDEIILQNGTYTTDERMRFLGSGTAENPVIFRAETPGGVIFTGGPRLTIGGETDDTTGDVIATGEYLVVDGFHWKGGYGASNFIEFRNGDNYAHHSTIQNCAIDGLGIEPSELAEDLADEQIPKHRWIVLYGTYNTVINCSFMNKVSAGAIVLGEYAYNAFPNVPEGEPEVNTSCLEVGHSVLNNYFYNYEKMTELYGRKANGDELSNAGDSETIRMGTSSYQMVNSNATISNNYFVQSDGENEIITNKSKGNTYTNNTFRRCRGSLVLRHGSYATVDGNYFLGEDVDGTGGIRISDSYHTITNNYIQDCITVVDFAKWNNGITFIGGGANADADCNFDNVSNGYQKTEGILLSNNSIVNTNAPLYFNVNTDNNNDVKGIVENNLVYFEASDPNITPVISGDEPTSYANIGASLTYSGNVWKGADGLGATNAGFSEEIGITAAADGEIFTFSGTGSDGKGANMGAYQPTTDAMVGYGIGACFLDYTGANISNGDCTIEIPESITVSSLSTLPFETGTYDVTVTANVSWTAASDDPSWISIDTASGAGNATVSVTVTENTGTESRTGSVTFTQVPGGDDIVRVLNITQDAPPPPDPRDGLNLINPLADDVEAVFACHEEIPPNHSKNNPMGDSLDKDPNTQWAGSAALGDCVDYVSIIYDLKGEFDLDLVDISTTSGKTYNLQIWVSSKVPDAPATYPEAADFTLVYPSSGFFQISTTPENKVPYTLPTPALGTRFVKIVGDGQPAGSRYTTIHEIEFYGDPSSLSVADNEFKKQVRIYPNPVTDNLSIKSEQSNINKLKVYNLDGRLVLEESYNASQSEVSINTSSFSNGMYLVNLSDVNGLQLSQLIIVSH